MIRTRRFPDPPLTPDGEEARESVRRELTDPRYHTDDLVDRIADRIIRWLDGLFGTTAEAGPIPTLVTIAVALALITAVLLLLSRARRTPRTAAAERPALTQERVAASDLRARATAALAAGSFDDAVVDGFRALALEQIERDRIADAPQATAHELGDAMAAVHSSDAAALLAAAGVFDAVRYGDHDATRQQAQSMLALEEQLRTVRR